MAIPFNLAQGENEAALTVFVNGQVKVANQAHPAWDQLKDIVLHNNNDDVDLDAFLRLFDSAEAVNQFFEAVSERVSVSGGHLYVDNEEVSDDLANAIIRFINEGADAGPLIKFLENVLSNPNEHSREQLYAWLAKRDFTITDRGTFLAYKGVRPRGGDDEYLYESISRGTAIVDGVPYKGAIPNGVGAVVEMPRGQVAHDPNVACHTGLHAGNWRYASQFSQGAVLTVEINPRDVVSVPHDSNSEKIRCCRYTVIDDKATTEISTAYSALDVDYDDEDDYDDEYDDGDLYY